MTFSPFQISLSSPRQCLSAMPFKLRSLAQCSVRDQILRPFGLPSACYAKTRERHRRIGVDDWPVLRRKTKLVRRQRVYLAVLCDRLFEHVGVEHFEREAYPRGVIKCVTSRRGVSA